MGTFDLEQEIKGQKNADEEITTTAEKRTWRHWMLGPIGFFFMCGAVSQASTGHQYIYRRVQEDLFPNKTFTEGISYCADGPANESNVQDFVHAQKVAANYELLFAVLSGVPTILSSIFLGAYADKFGRKFIMFVAISGKLTAVLVFVIGSIVHMDLKLFGISYVISGASGEMYTFFLASFAFVADITSSKSRAFGVLLVEISYGLGVTFALLVVGYIIQSFGFVSPFVVSASSIGLSLLIAIFILPESYPKDKRKSTKNKLEHFRRSFEFYYASWNRGYRWKYIIAILVIALTLLAFLGRASIETLYQLNKPFCWTPSEIGLFGALRMAAMQLVGFPVLKILKRFMDDDSIGIVGASSFLIAYIMEGSATNGVMLYLVAVFGCCGMLTVAMMRSLISRMTSADRQGAAAASISVAESVCHLVSGILMNAVYGATVAEFRGAAFFLMAGLSGLCIVLLVIFKIGSRSTQNKVTEGEKQEANITVVSFSKNSQMTP